jgi:putative transcriptional regulator
VPADDSQAANPGSGGPWIGLAPGPGRLLVAAPVLTEATFAHTVLYILEHDEGGTAAVILNRPSRTPVAHVLPNWHDAVSGPSVIFSGGPVQPDGALCLGLLSDVGRAMLAQADSSPGESAPIALRAVVDAICTVDLDGDVDPVVAATMGLRVFAGHAGWSPGQLDDELAEGSWFVLAGHSLDVFAANPQLLRRDVLRRQSAPLSLLSTYPRDASQN